MWVTSQAKAPRSLVGVVQGGFVSESSAVRRIVRDPDGRDARAAVEGPGRQRRRGAQRRRHGVSLSRLGPRLVLPRLGRFYLPEHPLAGVGKCSFPLLLGNGLKCAEPPPSPFALQVVQVAAVAGDEPMPFSSDTLLSTEEYAVV